MLSVERIKPKTRVEGRDGRKGVAVPDFMSCCSPEETPVVWDGTDVFEGTDTRTLKELGPENAVPDPKGCGAGRGAECCIFMTAGAKGLECERHSSMRYSLIFRKNQMHAQREPTEAFPACQIFGGDDAVRT